VTGGCARSDSGARQELDDRGLELAEFTLRKASMDKVFFKLTGHGAESDENGSRELEESNR
jgi:hypothetical protein